MLERAEVSPNEVISIAYVDLTDLLESAGPSDDAAELSSDDSIEIVAVGGKRPRACSSSSTSTADKRARLSPSAAGQTVLALSLALRPPRSPGPHPGQKSFLSTLAAHPPLQHPSILSPVVFTQKRGSIGTPHALAVALPDSLVPLLQLDPLDASNALACEWAQKGKHRVPSLGEGGLLDALVACKGVTLSCSLSIALEPTLLFHLSIKVDLVPVFFTDRTYSPSKHLVLAHLLPAPPPPPEYPGETTVDFFYSCLGRAPRTYLGSPISGAPPRSRIVRIERTNDERELERRRREKGKGRARDPLVDNDDDDDQDEQDEVFVDRGDDGVEDDLLRPSGLRATLLPFQSRSVRWLLAREGKVAVRVDEPEDRPMLDDDEMEENATDEPTFVLRDVDDEAKLEMARGPLWEKATLELPRTDDKDPRKMDVWLNRVASQISIDDPALAPRLDVQDGDEHKIVATGAGLLSEEMGLGKTVEIISLILLHPDPSRNSLPVYYNASVDSNVQPTSLTLIIAPAAIVAQWHSEISKHAPSLRVLRYENTKAIKDTWTPAYIAQHYDIVLTTFDVLRREVVLARKPHERALRSGREGRHRYRRSLLVQIDFLRVVMDEAQMVGDTVSLTSETASLIPRRYSFAVTGTPLKARIEDLQGLLRFLKLEPVGSNRAYLTRLLAEVPTFVRVCETLAARTVKAQVETELVIPPQHRFVVPVEFTAVEKYYYDARYLEALDHLGLESDGSPKDNESSSVDWALDKSEMNRWLVALRQLCCHPQVNQTGKRALGTTIKTVDDVLMSMRDSAVSAVQSDMRLLWVSRVRRAQLMTYDYEDCERFEKALVIFQSARDELEPMVDELVGAIRDAWNDRKAERIRRGRSSSVGTASSTEDSRSVGGALGLGLDDEEKAGEIPLSEKERSIAARLSALRNRLREVLLVQHAALFYSGATYFNMGKFADEERKAYADAEELRQTILRPYELRVDVAAARLKTQMDSREKEHELQIEDLEIAFSTTGHGIVGTHIFEAVEVCADVMNGYAEVIWSWRDTILGIMYQRVSISGDDATGDEYADRAELQEKGDVYLELYGGLLADWGFGLSGQRSALADVLDLEAYGYDSKKETWAAAEGSRRAHVAKGDKKKKGQKLKDARVPSLEAGDSPATVLRYELLVERAEAKGEGNEDVEIQPLRNSIKLLKDACERVEREEEAEMLGAEMKRLRTIFSDKEKLLDRLRGEYQDITRTFNARLQYFAQLQIVSDDVRDPDFTDPKWRGIPIEIELIVVEEERLKLSIAKKSSQRRYLESLAKDGSQPQEEAACVICSSEYTSGVLTTCGHLFCQACFSAWHHRAHTCAICKRDLRMGDYQSVKFRRDAVELVDRTEYEDVEQVAFERPVRLSTIDDKELRAIEEIETAAPLSSKSDLIVKHVKAIRRNDPTAKIVVFSAWVQALEIIMQAFARNGIGYVRLEGGGKKEAVVTKFIEDPAVAAFFLHTKSQSAGLNLTCAQYVFLVEPLLHPSLELQAVGRTHRIGQKKETCVYQYIVQASVDARLADLRGRNRSSLFLATGASSSAKEGRILQEDLVKASAPTKKGSEETIEDEDDIARILFTPEHFVNVQRALLPVSLRGRKKEIPTISQRAAEAAERRAAGGSGGGVVIGD